MNTSDADTRSPHLALEDLIAEVNGQLADDQARAHLAHCQECQAEKDRWAKVAGGVRGIAAPAAGQPGQPATRRRRVLAGSRPRVILAACAAAALVLGAAGYAASSALTRHKPGAVLTAVSGCATLREAAGSLVSVDGSSLVIKTASGRPVTVTTTPSTFVGASYIGLTGPQLKEITQGAPVVVAGSGSAGTIEAAVVITGPGASTGGAPTRFPDVVRGTVSGVTSSGFSVVTATGEQVQVSTSSATLLSIRNPSLNRLPIGAATFALGHAAADDTLAAQAVATTPPPSAGISVSISVHGCSRSDIAEALGG